MAYANYVVEIVCRNADGAEESIMTATGTHTRELAAARSFQIAALENLSSGTDGQLKLKLTLAERPTPPRSAS